MFDKVGKEYYTKNSNWDGTITCRFWSGRPSWTKGSHLPCSTRPGENKSLRKAETYQLYCHSFKSKIEKVPREICFSSCLVQLLCLSPGFLSSWFVFLHILQFRHSVMEPWCRTPILISTRSLYNVYKVFITSGYGKFATIENNEISK